MNWFDLLLAATALFLAAAAFRRSGEASSRQARDAARDASLRQDFALLRASIDSLPGRIADETSASPLREAVEAVRESITRMGESLDAHTAASGESDATSSFALTESVNSAISGLIAPLATLAESQGRQLDAALAQTRAVDGLVDAIRSASETADTTGSDSRLAVLAELGSLHRTWTESVASLRSDLEALPVRFAGTFGNVSRELSESAAQSREDRQAAAGSLESALRRLDEVATAVRSAMEPLEGALVGHGAAVAPLAQALQAAQERLEEASSTQRANQVEFSASVDLFGRAAQELSTGLSAFAREGEMEGLEDPRRTQNAMLESLERILKGFSESLRALLAESDLRTRETLAELSARLPGGETPA